MEKVNYGKNTEYSVNSDSISIKYENFLGYFLHGLILKSYQFDKYKSKKETRVITLNVVGSKNKPSDKSKLDLKH